MMPCYNMIKKKLLALVFLLLIFVPAFSQKGTIKGTIKDHTTGEPLIGATVLIAKGVGTVTDLDGKFSCVCRNTNNYSPGKFICYEN